MVRTGQWNVILLPDNKCSLQETRYGQDWAVERHPVARQQCSLQEIRYGQDWTVERHPVARQYVHPAGNKVWSGLENEMSFCG